MTDQNEGYMTINQAADYSHVSEQAVYVAIRKGKMVAKKENGKWLVTKKDLDEYRLNKYNRDNRMFNGERVFDADKGFFSVQQVSTVISHEIKRHFPMQHIYYLLRRGDLKAFRKGAAWVIAKEDAISLLEKVLEENRRQII
jgi:excisionase family DNA binding protein